MAKRYTADWFTATKLSAYLIKEAAESVVSACETLEGVYIDSEVLEKYSYLYPEFNELNKGLHKLVFAMCNGSFIDRAAQVASDTETLEEIECELGTLTQC